MQMVELIPSSHNRNSNTADRPLKKRAYLRRDGDGWSTMYMCLYTNLFYLISNYHAHPSPIFPNHLVYDIYIFRISHTNIQHLLFLQKKTNQMQPTTMMTTPYTLPLKKIDIQSVTQILNSLNPLTSTLPAPFFLHSASLSWWVLLLVWWRWFLFLGKPKRFLCLLVNLGGGIEGGSSWLAVEVVVVVVVVVVSSKEEREEKLSDS